MNHAQQHNIWLGNNVLRFSFSGSPNFTPGLCTFGHLRALTMRRQNVTCLCDPKKLN